MNRKIQSDIRKFKDSDRQLSLAAGGHAPAAGEPDELPDRRGREHAAHRRRTASPLAFGDFRRGYLIVDRLGMRILRDPYSAKPYVLSTRPSASAAAYRISNAIKLLKFAACIGRPST